jgi:HSP20 family molecular chaperone IbpA
MKNTALITAIVGLTLGTPAVVMAEQSKTPPAKAADANTTWSAQWQKLENELDKVFHDTTTKLNPGAKEQESTFRTSVDVRENPNAYVARIFLPKRDKANVSATFKNGILHITSSDKVAGTYDENIAIPSPVKANEMKVEKKADILVVTLPKKTNGMSAAGSTAAAVVPPVDTWDQQVIREMQQMQARMDRLTHDMLSDIPSPVAITQEPFFGSSVNLENEKDKYVVQFYLPDSNITKVNAEVKDNQLYLKASEESNKETTGKAGSAEEYSSGQYSETISLPGPVRASQMKLDRKEGMVTVTLPKA